MKGFSSDVIKTTQEQAVASWVEYLYNQRIFNVKKAFEKQDFNFTEALKELNLLKLFVADKNHILGSLSTKHGEIAEHCQVNISNARNLVNGLNREYTFENVGRLAPEDYLKNGDFVQSKFYNGAQGTLKAIVKHFNTYPDFIKNGGSYEIPHDQFYEINRVLNLYNSNKRSALSNEDMRLMRAILKMQQDIGIDFRKDIHTSVVSYKDVQVSKVDGTIEREEKSIRNTDFKKRQTIYNINKPSLNEAMSLSAQSALIEGGISFVLKYVKKRKSGQKITDFTTKDWKDLGIESGYGAVKGGIRGGAIYALTHFSATPACVASAYVTTSFGILEMLKKYRNQEIDGEEFVINCEALSLEISISAISSLTGQLLIPIPVLGTVIGNIIGMVIYSISKNKCTQHELDLIQRNRKLIADESVQLDQEYFYYAKMIKAQFDKFETIEAFAFDENVNTACLNSIRLAEMVGVSNENILRSDEDLRSYLQD